MRLLGAVNPRRVWGRNVSTYLVVDVIGPGASEEVLQGAVVGRELVFGQDVVRDDTSLAQLDLLIESGLERVGMIALLRWRSCRGGHILVFIATPPCH